MCSPKHLNLPDHLCCCRYLAIRMFFVFYSSSVHSFDPSFHTLPQYILPRLCDSARHTTRVNLLLPVCNPTETDENSFGRRFRRQKCGRCRRMHTEPNRQSLSRHRHVQYLWKSTVFLGPACNPPTALGVRQHTLFRHNLPFSGTAYCQYS